MKANIHPKETETKFVCACGNVIVAKSTLGVAEQSIDTLDEILSEWSVNDIKCIIDENSVIVVGIVLNPAVFIEKRQHCIFIVYESIIDKCVN